MVTDQPGISFGTLLRRLRAGVKLTQEELAEAAGLSYRSVSDLERGVNRTARKETALLLAGALGLTGQARALFVAAARGRAPACQVLAAVQETAAGAAGGLPAVPAVPQVRYSLPPDTAAFTGRGDELDRITAVLAGARAAGGIVAVGAVDGMPGVGKTALAVHAAHALAAEFPDRQMFVDLHAHTPGHDPVKAEDALAGLLAATGVDPRYLPGDLAGRAALWRDRMTGQRAVLVLDNAACSGQVAPLLPGSAGCLVLVTSRRHLGDLPAVVAPVLLDVLTPSEAADMFTRLAPRAAGDRAGTAEVVALAGYLPLAVSLLARVFARHPPWTLADLAAETRARVLAMTAENNSVAAAFEVSYRHLDPAAQRLFRLLGVHPGATIDGYAAAALVGTGPEEAAGLLDGLHREGLLTEVGYRRYGMHDLLRRYARDHAAAAGEGERALGRLLDYYQHAAARAEALLARQAGPGLAPATTAPPPAVPGLRDAGQALDWARAERASLLACLDYVTRAGQHARVVALTAVLTELFRRDGAWADAITRHTTAIRAARHCGDRLGQAGALRSLGEVRQLTGDFPGAARDLEQALDIFRGLGDQLGEAGALSGLGMVRQLTDDFSGAARDLEQALGIFRGLGDQLGEAGALSGLGAVRRVTGDYPGAARDLERALGIFRDLGNRLGEGSALGYLGDVRRLTGDFPGAARDLERALGIFRDLGDRFSEANALTSLAKVRRHTGDYAGAARDLEQALGIYRDLGSRRGEANALSYLGDVRRQTGDFPGAARDLERALGIFRDLGDQRGEASALGCLGVVRRLTGDFPGAARDFEQALGICRDLGDRGGEAELLNEAGTLHRVSGDPARAGGCHQQALELARAIASPWDEAHALAGLGRCAIAATRTAQAEVLLRQALKIFQRIGAAEAGDLLAALDTLTRPLSAS